MKPYSYSIHNIVMLSNVIRGTTILLKDLVLIRIFEIDNIFFF